MVVMDPLIQLLLFAGAINTDVRNVPIAGHRSISMTSRMLVEAIKATQAVKVVDHYATPSKGETLLLMGMLKRYWYCQRIFSVALMSRINLTMAGGWFRYCYIQDPLCNCKICLLLMYCPRAQSLPSFEIALFFNPERHRAKYYSRVTGGNTDYDNDFVYVGW